MVTLLRLVRLLRQREIEEAVEARRVADWPRLAEADRRNRRLRWQEALSALADPMPFAEDALGDPAAREHVRRLRQRVRENASALRR